MKKEQYKVANLEQSSQAQPGWLFRLARPLAFLLAIVLSLWAIYAFVAAVQVVNRDPMIVLPEQTTWTAGQLKEALGRLSLSESFFATYALAFSLVFSLTFLACGWLILWRKNQDWFGLYLGISLLSWANAVGAFASVPSPMLPGFDLVLGPLIWTSLFYLLYLFPNGRATPHWARWFAWGLVLFTAIAILSNLFQYQTFFSIFALPFVFAFLLAGVYAQIYRHRHARPLERQQIKWVVLAMLVFAANIIILSMFQNFTGLGDPGRNPLTTSLIAQMIYLTLSNLAFLAVPISIVFSISRYRLWDIDVLVRKTLIYGVLTTVLSLVFFGGVTLLQGVFGGITRTEESPVAIVISTLLIAALFSPLRRRIQDFIDRRFYRQKYNAEQALADFAATARNETDLEALTGKLAEVVSQTMQPMQVSVWMRMSSSGRSDRRLSEIGTGKSR